MTPHAENVSPEDIDIARLPAPARPLPSANPPRILIIGAGSRGNSYARATQDSTNGIVVAVAEPVAYKRRRLGERYIWGSGSGDASAGPGEGQAFEDWREFASWEVTRRERVRAGEENVPEGVDAVFVCVLDEMHKDVIVGLAPLNLHVMCEKPLATCLEDCVEVYKALLPGPGKKQERIFSIGHVLRYSPHNMLLRKLLLQDRVIGEIMSINHTEPVGWWHFTHSYVRYVIKLLEDNLQRLTVKGQLAQGIHHSTNPLNKVLPRHRPPPLAPLLSTTRLIPTSPYPKHSGLVGLTAIL